MRHLVLLLGLVVLCMFASPVLALIVVGRGSDRVRDPGWPAGALAVANLPSRVGWWVGPPQGGGRWEFLYRGDANALGEALAAFAKVEAKGLEVHVVDGPRAVGLLKEGPDDEETETRVDWTFAVWQPDHYRRLYDDPAAPAPDANDPYAGKPHPRLTVYVGGDGAGIADWSKVSVPDNVKVVDERAKSADRATRGK